MARSGLADLDALASAFIEAVSTIPPYSDGIVPEEVLRPDTEGSFELMLRLIAGLPLPPRLEELCERIGRNRARTGVPLDVLLRVIRIDFTILWDALVQYAEQDQYPELVQSAGRVWNALEQYTVGIQRAYLDEAALLARERDQERSALVAGLITTDGREPFLSQVATALGMRVDASFLVAVAPRESEKAIRRAADRLRGRRVPVHVQVTGNHRLVLIAQLPGGTSQAPADWLNSVPCGQGPLAVGLREVPRIIAICDQIADTISARDMDPVTLVDRWTQIVAQRLSDLTPSLCASVLPDPTSISDTEWVRLLDTIRVYLRTGSVSSTAASMYCHRNTVVNRLNRFSELSGYDITVPGHAAAVSVALACTPEFAREARRN